MDAAELLVTTGGVFLVGLILWFFFGAKTAAAAKEAPGGVQEVTIVVHGAYAPDRIEVEAGRPVRLNFRRDEETACTAEVVLPDFGIVTPLPFGATTPVEFTPDAPGEYPFHCGMNMVRGRILVREPGGSAAANRRE